ncbi:hypothetical protein vBPaeMUSP18_65 [Pseudomonas phage vB_PaeM_USP_18]|nr:hypothetical protein vBPaeMUSP18_65 [Pseudomonas phage vB_PaeM_USP_18]QLI49510.1 hypothetical protein vBPaeMUSP25_65 [Pseudomonas phage vB_PaeM_USP_25]
MKKEDLPLYHVALGRALLVVAEFPDTEEGAKQANAYMEAHPGIGVLEARNGRVILASNEDKGVKLDGPVRGLTCTCCGSYLKGRQFHNQDTGYGLCNDCIDYCGRHFDADQFQRTYGLRGAHYDIQELPA